MEQDLVPISALQHFAFCPRQCALIHIERQWAENYLTAQGQQLHQRVDQGMPEKRKGVRFERGVEVTAHTLGLSGKLDLLEIHQQPLRYIPVEYKRGKAKANDIDKIQLCAQVLCLEEMKNCQIPRASLWYWQTRQRHEVEMDEALRTKTLATLAAVKQIFEQPQLPSAHAQKSCQACSLYDNCQPKHVSQDRTQDYIESIYQMEEK